MTYRGAYMWDYEVAGGYGCTWWSVCLSRYKCVSRESLWNLESEPLPGGGDDTSKGVGMEVGDVRPSPSPRYPLLRVRTLPRVSETRSNLRPPG